MSSERVQSGLSWIGDIPSHWSVVPTRSVLRLAKNLVGDDWSTTQLLSLTRAGVVKRDPASGEGKFPSSFETYQRVEPDDLVFCLFDMDETPRTLGLSPHSGMVPGANTRFRVNRSMADPRYLGWYYLAIDERKRFRPLYSGLRKVIQKSRFLSAGVALPPLTEQRAIADYLDRETAQIDTLIEEQQRLIDLLHERRQRVLSRAAEGEWVTASLGLLLDGIKDGTHGSFVRTEPGDGMPLLGARNIMGSRLVLDGAESFISDEDHQSIVANGFPSTDDVLLVIVGATIGKTAVYDLQTRHAFQRSVAFLRPSQRLDSRFLCFQIQTKRFQDELWLRAKTSAQPGIYMGDVTAIPISVPPLDEQLRIVASLERETAKIDDVIAETERFIELSRERRSALITAAVTGQIDVRNEVA